MEIGSASECELIITISKNGLKLLNSNGVVNLLPKTKKEALKDGVRLKYKMTPNQASFFAMFHKSEMYGITVDIEPKGFTTTVTPLRAQMTDECIEGLCAMFIVYEKSNMNDERKKTWNSQLVLGNLLLKKFDKWNAWRTITAMYLMNYHKPLQLKLLSNITQIDTAIGFTEAERIFNIVNDKKLGTVQGYKR